MKPPTVKRLRHHRHGAHEEQVPVGVVRRQLAGENPCLRLIGRFGRRVCQRPGARPPNRAWVDFVTGKTHLAIALGVEATKQKRRVLFTRAADLVRQLLEARDSRELARLQQRLLRVDVLIVDELGFVPFDRVGGELLSSI